MTTTNRPTNDIPNDDELDDILNGVVDGKDIFDTSDIRPQIEPPKQQKPSTTDMAGLGLDEEITLVQKRRPIPKLDEARLLTDAGIPKLRKISKNRLRFKGKGHEFGDIVRMLNMYQLWLDDLYPRAKFADALTISEKLGHTKRMQYMRKQWIDESKPKRITESDDESGIPSGTTHSNTEQMEGIISSDAAIEAGQQQQRGLETVSPRQDSYPGAEAGGNPDDDELDALLAETQPINLSVTAAGPQAQTIAHTEDLFADDMEAMAEMEDMW